MVAIPSWSRDTSTMYEKESEGETKSAAAAAACPLYPVSRREQELLRWREEVEVYALANDLGYAFSNHARVTELSDMEKDQAKACRKLAGILYTSAQHEVSRRIKAGE